MATAPRLSLVHLSRPPRISSSQRPPLLLLLHGVGSHEGDLIGLTPYLDGRFFIVSARGPITIGPGMYAWFHVQVDRINPVINPEEADRSRLALFSFIDELVAAYSTDPLRTYLLGFSQGAIISLALALTHPDKLAGVVAMSGRVLPEVLPKKAPAEAMRGLPILVIHGTEDPVLPIHHGRAARELLSSMPVALTYREYPIGHHVSEESLADVTAWLRQRLEEPPWQSRAVRSPDATEEGRPR